MQRREGQEQLSIFVIVYFLVSVWIFQNCKSKWCEGGSEIAIQPTQVIAVTPEAVSCAFSCRSWAARPPAVLTHPEEGGRASLRVETKVDVSRKKKSFADYCTVWRGTPSRYIRRDKELNCFVLLCRFIVKKNLSFTFFFSKLQASLVAVGTCIEVFIVFALGTWTDFFPN